MGEIVELRYYLIHFSTGMIDLLTRVIISGLNREGHKLRFA
jgi:hypothetical protein